MSELSAETMEGEIQEEQMEHGLSKYQDNLPNSGRDAKESVLAHIVPQGTEEGKIVSKMPTSLKRAKATKVCAKVTSNSMEKNPYKVCTLVFA